MVTAELRCVRILRHLCRSLCATGCAWLIQRHRRTRSILQTGLSPIISHGCSVNLEVVGNGKLVKRHQRLLR